MWQSLYEELSDSGFMIVAVAMGSWVAHGADSRHAFSAEQARAHVPAFTPEIAEAHACFHLGRHLYEAGNRREGAELLRRATELNPDSWSFFRQMKNLENVLGSGGPAFEVVRE